jgi:2-C-methyl-D-erythritol 2,4-cyclodiphosphate synthase
MSIRIGQGYDVHAFTEGDHLMLGGVRIPFEKCFKAHSDGDVVLHALSDALLGAAGLGDIGRHFPDTDDQFSNIDSRILLRHVMSLLRERGWQVGNVDITIIAQAPKMAPHIQAMCANVVEDLGVELTAVNIKATTTEHLGFEGRGEGIAVTAVALITQ